MKGSKVVLLVLAALLVVFVAEPTAAGASRVGPLEGTFENCNLNTAFDLCVPRLAKLRAGGFSVLVQSVYSKDATERYAAEAAKAGVQIMWAIASEQWWRTPLSSTSMLGSYGEYTAACNATNNGELLTYLAKTLNAYPATYGYYAADDSMLQKGDRKGIKAYIGTLKAGAPDKVVMISAYSSHQQAEYIDIADMIGQEIYPLRGDPKGKIDSEDISYEVRFTADQTGKQTRKHKKAAAFILQSFTWSDNIEDGKAVGVCKATDTRDTCYPKSRYPSPAEQALMHRTTLDTVPETKLILWWNWSQTIGLPSGENTDGFSRFPTGAEAAKRWKGLIAASRALPKKLLKKAAAKPKPKRKPAPKTTRKLKPASKRSKV
jgi:hypothetical protein